MKKLSEIANYHKLLNNNGDNYKVDRHEDELYPHYNRKKLSNSEHNEIKNYWGDSSVNNYLWQRHKKQENPDYSYDNRIKNIDSALGKFKTPKAMNVWSGTRHDPREIKNEKGIVHHPAYLSTSIKHSMAATFANIQSDDKGRHILKIRIPKDHPGYYLGASEHEFILPRGTNLKHKFTKTMETERPGDGKNPPKKLTFHVHHMDIVK